MPQRTARLGSMFYKDADGRFRDASAGEVIDVHPDFVDLFDSLNVLLGQKPENVKPEPETPVQEKPKPRGRPRKADSE